MRKILICILLFSLCVGILASCNLNADDGNESEQQNTADTASEEVNTEDSNQSYTGGGNQPHSSRPGAGNSSTPEDDITLPGKDETPAPPAASTKDGNELPPIWLE